MRPLRSLNPVLADLALLLTRVVLGVVFIAHGWQKLTEFGIAGTTKAFAGMGIPAASLAAPFTAGVELIGGALLLVGALTPLAGSLLALVMLGAALLVHLGNGVFAAENGWELVAALAVGALVLAVVGPGRFSVDQALRREPVNA